MVSTGVEKWAILGSNSGQYRGRKVGKGGVEKWSSYLSSKKVIRNSLIFNSFIYN